MTDDQKGPNTEMMIRGVTNLETAKEAIVDESAYRNVEREIDRVLRDYDDAQKLRNSAVRYVQVPFCPDCKANHPKGAACEGRT